MDDKTFEIEIGKKATKGIPIPLPPSRDFKITPRVQMFDTQAKRYMNISVKEQQEFVNLPNSFALYDDMTAAQKNWYYYWRYKARKGELISSGINYINLYINETLNGIGVSDKYNGFDKLLAIWITYKEEHSVINEYLPTWIIDYFLLHDVSEKINLLIEFQWPTIELDILLTLIPNKIDLLKSFYAINNYSNYKIMNSAFFKKYKHQHIIIEAIEKVITSLEKYFVEKQGASIVEKYTPYYNSKLTRQAFRGSLYSGLSAINVKYKNYSHCEELLYFIGNIIRHTENIIRERSGAKPNLKTTFIPQSYLDIIYESLEYIPISPVNHRSSEQKDNNLTNNIKSEKIKVDLDKVSKLIKETDEIQKLLIIEEPQVTDIKPIITFEKTEYELSEPTDEISEIMSKLNSVELEILKLLSYESDFSVISEVAISNNILPSKIFDDINEISYEIINDMIIDTSETPKIYEEYLDSILKSIGRKP